MFYKINHKMSYNSILDELKKVLENKRNDLQRMYKMKAGALNLQGAAGKNYSVMVRSNDQNSKDLLSSDKGLNKVSTTDVIKGINKDVQDLTEDIGDLETSLLMLRHYQPASGKLFYNA